MKKLIKALLMVVFVGTVYLGGVPFIHNNSEVTAYASFKNKKMKGAPLSWESYTTRASKSGVLSVAHNTKGKFKIKMTTYYSKPHKKSSVRIKKVKVHYTNESSSPYVVIFDVQKKTGKVKSGLYKFGTRGISRDLKKGTHTVTWKANVSHAQLAMLSIMPSIVYGGGGGDRYEYFDIIR